MSQFERFVTTDDEKADELATAGANTGRRVYGRSKSIICATGKRGGVCSIAVCGQLPLPGTTMEGL